MYEYGEVIQYSGSEEYWIGVFVHSNTNTSYQGLIGHVHHSRDTWMFARTISTLGHYQESDYHIFYEGKECHPFQPDRGYMSDHEVFECLLDSMKFHHIWYDDLGFDFSL